MQTIDLTTISVDGDRDYEQEVARLVRRILTTTTGQAIGFKIRSHGKLLIIESNAKDFQAETRSSGPVAIISFYPNTRLDHADVSLMMGSMGTLKVRTLRLSPGYGPDEVLFHEMVHAGRLLGNDDGPIPQEEYFAVLIANIYISEKGKSFKDLRYRYEAMSRPYTENEVEPFVYLLQWDQTKKEEHYDLVEKFCHQHPNIAPMIAKGRGKFNPIRDYYELQENLKDIIKQIEEPGPLPIKITQNEPYVPITDDYLINLLEPRFHATDVAGYGERARKLEQLFGRLTPIETIPLLYRLVSGKGDRVAMLFHGHLATATRAKLINVLRTRLNEWTR